MAASPEEILPSAALPDAAGVLAQARDENFPVALRLLPRAERRHLNAIYGFARLVDDIGDEHPGDRSHALSLIDRDIDAIYSGGEPEHPLMRELGKSARACDFPEKPLRDLVAANRQDQEVSRYATYSDLAHYCTLSANPVGRLVLAVFGATTPGNVERSDAVCTALQILEHCQDVGEDYRRGRIYLPEEDLAAFGCEPSALGAAKANPELRRVIAFEIERVRELLGSGDHLVKALSGFARFAVAGFTAGGYAGADAVEAQGHDVLLKLAKPRRLQTLRHALRLILRGPR